MYHSVNYNCTDEVFSRPLLGSVQNQGIEKRSFYVLNVAANNFVYSPLTRPNSEANLGGKKLDWKNTILFGSNSKQRLGQSRYTSRSSQKANNLWFPFSYCRRESSCSGLNQMQSGNELL